MVRPIIVQNPTLAKPPSQRTPRRLPIRLERARPPAAPQRASYQGSASEVVENFTNACATWKSGASAPRKAFKINSASAAVVVFAVRHDFFRNLFSRAASAL